MGVEHDEIGIWSKLKLEIIRKYAAANTTAMKAQQQDTIGAACVGCTLMVTRVLGTTFPKLGMN